MKKIEDRKKYLHPNWKYFYHVKITLLLMFVFIIQMKGNALSQQQFVSIDLKNCNIEELFREIKKQTGIRFMYKNEYVKHISRFDVKAEKKDVKLLLEEVFKGTDLVCLFEQDVIILLKRTEAEQKKKEAKPFKGKLLDKKGQPLPGATVLIKGTTIGIMTDTAGRFTLTLPEIKDITLVFRFVGMETKEIMLKDIKDEKVLKGEADYVVTLVESIESLDDVVVTGYGNLRKESYTGNAVRVEGEEIMKVANRNVIAALQVFDPSFRIMENNAMGSNPNAIPEFYVRGHSGIGNLELDDVSEARIKNNPNLPIFILDGLDVSVEKIYDMDPNRIHSITILKDAMATAVYGSRASNGVIVIETIAPKAGKFNISYNLTGSITAPDLSSYDYFDAREKLEVEELVGFYVVDPTNYNKGVRNVYTELWKKQMAIDKGVNTDWMALPLRVGYNHKHSVAIDGGNDNIRYGISLFYDNQKGVMRKDYRNRLGTELRIDYRMENIDVINRISFNKISTKNSPYGTFSDYVGQLPYNELYDAFGNYVYNFPVWHSGSSYINPMYEGASTKNYNKGGSEEFSDNLMVDWRIKHFLRLKAQIGFTRTTNTNRAFTDPASGKYYSGYDDVEKGELSTTDGKSYKWTTNLQLMYNQTLGNNYISASLGFNTTETKTTSTGINYQGFPSGNLSSIMYAQKIVGMPSESDNHTRLMGGFFLLNYSYNDIYLGDVSVRLDGSSEFGSEKKYAPFWSAGVGINIHNYKFLKGNSLVSQLKVTATYGQTGKLNFAPYAAKDIYEIFSGGWYATGMGVKLMALGNEHLNWEKKDSYDLKVELNIKQGLLYVKAAYYNAITNDMITQVTIPSSFGFKTYYDNVGKIENIGYELDLKSNIIIKENLFVSVYGNLAHNKNKILKISNSLREYNKKVDEYYSGYYASPDYYNPSQEKYTKPFTKYEEGGSTTSIYGMKSLGIDPSSGQEVFERKDGTITYEWEANEQQVLGNTLPKIQGSFGLNVQWKSLSLFASFMYEHGGQAYNSTIATRIETVDLYNYNADKRVLSDRWIELGDITPLKDIADQTAYSRPTSRFVQKNNILKFNSLSVAWTLDHGFIKRIGMHQLKCQFNMNDVAHWSTVKQERGTSYPFARTFDFTLGLNF